MAAAVVELVMATVIMMKMMTMTMTVKIYSNRRFSFQCIDKLKANTRIAAPKDYFLAQLQRSIY